MKVEFSRLPRRAPELSAGIARRGAARMQRVARGPGMALLATPVESEERRKQAATGPPFLWLFSFGGAKESNSPSGAINPVQITVAVATLFFK